MAIKKNAKEKKNKKNSSNFIIDIGKGIAIGVANIIPGVSGGTMALVLGLFERLITALKSITFSTFISFFMVFSFKRKHWNEFKAEMSRVDAGILIRIGIGIAITFLSLASVMTYLLEKQHDPTYGFFFGLILASVLVPFRLIKQRTFSRLIMFILAVFIVIGFSSLMSGEKLIENAKAKQELNTGRIIEGSSTVETPDIGIGRLTFIFFAGAAAISAMILPGISGSFLLLLLGLYFDMLKAIINMQLLIIFIFSLGCLIGMLLFTRFLNLLLNKWHDLTMSFLLGLVVGSLWPIWPFKTSMVIGEERIYLYNRLPNAIGGNELATLITTLIGVIIIALFIVIEKRIQKTA